MISDENIKMGNKALADEVETLTGASGEELESALNQTLKKLGNQALMLRDKIQENPKAAAGIALALAGGIYAITRSVSASRRRQNTVTKLLVAAGLWKTLAPLLRSARKRAPKLQKAGMKRLSGVGDLLRNNAGPLFERVAPYVARRLSH
jgi:hypothetical protein